MDIVRARQEAKWEEMSAGQKVSDFVRRHEYGVIVGSWAAAMTGAFSYIMRDPCVHPSMNPGLVLTRRRTASRLFPRRSVLNIGLGIRLTDVVQVVQARMWAQGLTIGIIIAAGILTHSQRSKAYEEEDEHRVRHLVRNLCSDFGASAHLFLPLAQPADHSWQDILAQEERERAAKSGRSA